MILTMFSVIPTSEMNSPVLLLATTLVLFAGTNGNPQELQQEGRDAQGRPLTTSLGIGNRFGGNRFGGRFSNSSRERLRNIFRGKRSPQELQQEGRDAQGRPLTTSLGIGNRFGGNRFGGRFSNSFRERLRNILRGKRSPQELQQEGRDAQGAFSLATGFGRGNRNRNRFGGRFSDRLRERFRNRG